MENSIVFDGAYPNAIIQSKIGEKNGNKGEVLQIIEGKENLDVSENDIIIGYTSNRSINLLHKQIAEKGGMEQMSKVDKTELDETTEVETQNNEVDETTDVSTEQTDVTETEVTENVEEVETENTQSVDEVDNSVENSETTEAMYSEKEILEKFENIADSLESLVKLAKEGFENRNEVIKQSLESGVHSMGNSFNKDIFEKTFSNMETKDIQEMGKVWENQVKALFSDKKVSKVVMSNETTDEEIRVDLKQFKTSNY